MTTGVDQGRDPFIHLEFEVFVNYEDYLFVNSRIFSHLTGVLGLLAVVYLDNNGEHSDEK